MRLFLKFPLRALTNMIYLVFLFPVGVELRGEAPAPGGPSVLSPSDKNAVVQAVLDFAPLQPYLHPDQPQRSPLVLSTSRIGKDLTLRKFEKPVTLLDDKDITGPHFRFTEFRCKENNYCNVRFAYPVEGVVGSSGVRKDRLGAWQLEKTDISEKSASIQVVLKSAGDPISLTDAQQRGLVDRALDYIAQCNFNSRDSSVVANVHTAFRKSWGEKSHESVLPKSHLAIYFKDTVEVSSISGKIRLTEILFDLEKTAATVVPTFTRDGSKNEVLEYSKCSPANPLCLENLADYLAPQNQEICRQVREAAL